MALLLLLPLFPLPSLSQDGGSILLPDLVEIPAGRYLMGTPDAEEGRRSDEGPQHQVSINKSFHVSKTEITRAQFQDFIAATGYEPVDGCLSQVDGRWQVREGITWRATGFRQADDEAVVCVNWHDARAYTQWLSETSGHRWRLPSEAEWEYFARAGSLGKYHNDENEQALCTIAYAVNPEICPSTYGRVAPVASFQANEFGLYDTLGNVWEWVEDCYHHTYDGAPSDQSPWVEDCDDVTQQGRSLNPLRVIRGGAAFSPPAFVRSGLRSWSQEGMGHVNVGFRVVSEKKPPFNQE